MADENPLGWEFEPRDERSALIEKLRALPRFALPDVGDYVKASDLDAVVNSAIQQPKDGE